MRLTAAVTKDENWYVARCLEVEVTGQGRTVEEALANLQGSSQCVQGGLFMFAI